MVFGLFVVDWMCLVCICLYLGKSRRLTHPKQAFPDLITQRNVEGCCIQMITERFVAKLPFMARPGFLPLGMAVHDRVGDGVVTVVDGEAAYPAGEFHVVRD